jgi:GxxExxY protein
VIESKRSLLTQILLILLLWENHSTNKSTLYQLFSANGYRKFRKLNDQNDTTIRTMREEKELPYADLTNVILGCCFDVMKELGPGFLERVYKNALLIAMRQKGLEVEVEQPYEVIFRGKVIGQYNADLVINKTVIVELKCCDALIREHQAQLFNYLKVSGLPIGLLVNFRRRKLEWKRLQSNEEYYEVEKIEEESLSKFFL